jgi:signal transduction histidine kinase/DNA-binding response OmpR family regulator
VERAPEVPMFDWRQLQRWGVREDRLPRGSVIQFRELTVWQQHKWRIVALISVFALQALLIGALLLERRRSRRSQVELKQYKEHLEQLVQQRTTELVEARDQAMAADRSKTVFLANMSHELRTPLNAILGFSSLILRDSSLSDQHRQDLAVVGSSGEHLLELIDEVLDMAKIETSNTAVESAQFDLHSLVHDTVKLLRERAHVKNLELLLDISPAVPQFLRSDPGKLRQVLTNLVGNGVKYTDEGSVVVRLDVKFGENSPDLVLIFDVEDTGIGIAPEDQDRIFDPFVQAGGSRKRKGTGLGLSISRRFVQLLGGIIQVESTPGQGSRFHVEIPAQMGDASEAGSESASLRQVIGLEPGQPDHRILIVEDQRENWLLLQRLLQSAGFNVQVREDGGQAVEGFRLWRPHFIWMDLRLPVLSGIEAARCIREMEGGREVKIVAVTASAFDSQRDDVLAAGFDGFLRKPYRPMEIFDCMARHLGVQYVYAAGPQLAAGDLPATLNTADLERLPAMLRDELGKTIVSLDRKRIALLVARVSEENIHLGRVLGRLTDRFAYTPILKALQSCNKRFTKVS